MNPRLAITSQPRINGRAGLIRLLKKILPGPWTLIFLISGLLVLHVIRVIILSFTGTDFR